MYVCMYPAKILMNNINNNNSELIYNHSYFKPLIKVRY